MKILAHFLWSNRVLSVEDSSMSQLVTPIFQYSVGSNSGVIGGVVDVHILFFPHRYIFFLLFVLCGFPSKGGASKGFILLKIIGFWYLFIISAISFFSSVVG